MGIRLVETKTKEKSISEPIKLTSSKKKFASIGEQIKKARKIPVLKKLFTPTALGLTSGGAVTLATGNPIAGLITGFSTPVVTEALVSSPTLDKAVSTRVTNPAGVGKGIGEFIENPKEKIKEGLTNLGESIKENPIIAGGIATAGLTAGGIALKKAIDKAKSTSKSIGSTSFLSGSTPVSSPILSGGIPTAPASIKEKPEEKAIEKPKEIQTPSINVRVRPVINIKNKVDNRKIYKAETRLINN